MAITKLKHHQINNIAPSFGGYLNTAQSVTDGNWNAVGWDTDTRDDFNMHDPSSNPERITVPEDGKYIVNCLISWSGGTGVTQADIDLMKNNTSDIDISGDTMLDSRRYLFVEAMVNMTEGDYVSIKVKFVGNTGTVSLRALECGIQVTKIAE